MSKQACLRKDSKICVIRSKNPPEHAQWVYIVDYYLKEAGYMNVDVVDIDKLTCGNQMKDIMNRHYDLLFSVACGCILEPKAGIDVCQYLHEKCDIPFVNPTVRCFDPSREEMKKICILNNIPTPKHAFVYDLQTDIKGLEFLQFPMIVKHYNSTDSRDLTKDSKVFNKEQLEFQVRRMVGKNHGALVEQFIEGRQFTCLIADNWENLSEPLIYEPVEFIFHRDQTFKTEALKYEDGQHMSAIPVTDPQIAKNVKEVCKAFFKAIEFESYARFDLRMNDKGELFMLEINAIPCLFYPPNDFGSADEIVSKSPGGHSAFLENAMKAAVVRYNLKQKGWKVEYSTSTGYICRSTRAFTKEECVYDFSDKQMKINPLKSLKKIAEAEAQVKLHPRFYLPISDTLVITSENEIDNYRFMQQSTEPNCWLDQFCIRARRAIKPNEQLTFDYATLYGNDWRNLIESKQQRLEQTNWKNLVTKYEGHVSKFVELKAKQQT